MANTIVIFGASGDLTSRKLIPALYSLHAKDRLPPQTRIVGVSRSSYEHQQWRESLRETTEKFRRNFSTMTPGKRSASMSSTCPGISRNHPTLKSWPPR